MNFLPVLLITMSITLASCGRHEELHSFISSETVVNRLCASDSCTYELSSGHTVRGRGIHIKTGDKVFIYRSDVTGRPFALPVYGGKKIAVNRFKAGPLKY